MVLVTQSFGNESEYKRALFCLASFYAYCSERSECYLFTDNPDYFRKYLPDFPVRYFLLTPEKIKALRGSIDFLHRMKIGIIDEAFQHTDQNLLYVDSDTFFLKNPFDAVAKVSPGISFMHLREYSFESMNQWMLPAGIPFRDFAKFISTNVFSMPDGSTLRVNINNYSWNAGVMIFHPSHRKYIPEVYVVTDATYPVTRNHACEQYAFSIVMQHHTSVQQCDDMSYHYWYRVKKKLADPFLNAEVARFGEGPLSCETLERVKVVTAELPSWIENHILFLQDESIQRFNENHFLKGYKFAFRVLMKNPFLFSFIRDVLYHTRRMLFGK